MSVPTINTLTAKPAMLVIFALTYLGVALGHVPGSKLNRTGIALLGAIAIMIFSDLPTGVAVGFINWPTIFLLFGFFVLSAQLRLSGFFDKVAAGISARLVRRRGEGDGGGGVGTVNTALPLVTEPAWLLTCTV